jgi:hypothetical protein
VHRGIPSTHTERCTRRRLERSTRFVCIASTTAFILHIPARTTFDWRNRLIESTLYPKHETYRIKSTLQPELFPNDRLYIQSDSSDEAARTAVFGRTKRKASMEVVCRRGIMSGGGNSKVTCFVNDRARTPHNYATWQCMRSPQMIKRAAKVKMSQGIEGVTKCFVDVAIACGVKNCNMALRSASRAELTCSRYRTIDPSDLSMFLMHT